LASVAYSDVAAWVADLVAGGLAPATVRYAHRVFSLTLAHAVRAGRLVRNPAEGVPLPRLVRKPPVFLDHGQVARIAGACDPHGLLVRFLAYTGLRWGEATALRVHRLDLVRRRVTVATAFVSIDGQLVEGTPKTHRFREVPVPRFLARQLEEHVAELDPEGTGVHDIVGCAAAELELPATDLAAGYRGLRPARLAGTRLAPHGGEPGRQVGREPEGRAADARSRLRDDARRVRRAVQRRPR
jgi:integrase